VLLALPVMADMLDVPMLVNNAPEPLNVVAVTVPLTFNAPLVVVVPIATLPAQVEFVPATVPDHVEEAAVIEPVKVGDAESTTLPVPVDGVVQLINVPFVVQKSPAVSVPPLAPREPALIQLVPLQYCRTL
jgi:hypothetical protein